MTGVSVPSAIGVVGLVGLIACTAFAVEIPGPYVITGIMFWVGLDKTTQPAKDD